MQPHKPARGAQFAWADQDRLRCPRRPGLLRLCLSPCLALLFWLNTVILSHFEHLCEHGDIHLQQISHTGILGSDGSFYSNGRVLGLWVNTRAVIISWRRLHGLSLLSLCSSATVPPPPPPPLVPLKQHPHFCCKLPPPPPPPLPPSPHLFILSSLYHLSVRIQWTKPRTDRLRPLHRGWVGDRVAWVITTHPHTHTHTYARAMHLHPTQLFMYLSLQFTGWLDFITSTIMCLQSVWHGGRGRDGEGERGASRGGLGNYIIFLSEYISQNCVTT